MKNRKSWTADDDGILRYHFGKTPTRIISKWLGRSNTAIRARAAAIGLAANPHWTAEETQYLIEHADDKPLRVALALGRSLKAVLSKKRKVLPERTLAHRAWTDAERDYVRERYPHEQTKVTAEALGRTVPAVRQCAKDMGVTKSSEYIAEYKAVNAARLATLPKEKRIASLRRTMRRERGRIALGLPQKTKRKLTREPRRKSQYRCRMKSLGYIVDGEDRNVLYFTAGMKRHKRAEKSAAKYRMRIEPLDNEQKQ